MLDSAPLIALLLSALTAVPASAAEQPNIVVLFADDLGYGELSCQGNPEIPTPHIDSIACQWCAFHLRLRCRSELQSRLVPGCLRAVRRRASATSSIPPGLAMKNRGSACLLRRVTIAESLHDAGYTTGLIGKWHQGGAAKYHPFRHGFDEFFGFTHEGHYFVPPPYKGVTTLLRRKTLPGGGKGRWIGKKGLIYGTHMGNDEPDYDANNPIVRGGQPVVETEYLTDALTREAVDFIDRHDDKPFFLYLAYNAVHSPLQGADAYMKKFAHIEDIHRRIFAAMLANMDDSVGARDGINCESRALKKTRSSFSSATTVVRRGNSLLPIGRYEVRRGRCMKARSEFPSWSSGRATCLRGNVYDKPASSMDIFATASTVAGAKMPKQVEGVNLLPYLTGKDKRHGRTRLSSGVRVERPRCATATGNCLRMGRKLEPGQAPWELYDLSKRHLRSHESRRVQPGTRHRTADDLGEDEQRNERSAVLIRNA